MRLILSHSFVPIHRAAIRGHTEIVGSLLRAGVDPNIGDYEGYTPLHFAAKAGHWDCCDLLYRSGSDPLRSNDLAFTPLDFAQKFKFEDVITLLSTPRHKLAMTPTEPKQAEARKSTVDLLQTKE
jgi:ankyrin repeat protein